MKSKGGSLYEVLKSASRPSGSDDAGASGPGMTAPSAAESAATLQERLAAYKAAKLAAANSGTAVESAPAKPAAATVVLEPDPTPIPAPPPAPTRLMAPTPIPALAPAPTVVQAPAEDTPLPAPAKGPGERVVKLTYNTALFSGMIVVGMLFIAYAIGLHKGRTSVPADAPAPAAKAAPILDVAPPPPIRQNPVPPPAKKEFTIRLGEWKYGTSQERVRALALADDPDLKKQLERAGHKSFEKTFINKGAEVRMALFVDRFTDLNSESAKAALTAMKNFRFKNTTPFAQAAFEEKPQ